MSSAIADYLRHARYVVDCCEEGEDGLSRIRHFNYDLVILDWDLLGMSGYDVCKQLRSEGNAIPIIMLTGKKAVQDKTLGLDAGADDYIVKPVHMDELTARIRANLRRASAQTTNVLVVGNIQLDPQDYSCLVDAHPVALPRKEFELLEVFLRYPGRVFSVSELIERVWPKENDTTDDAVRNCIVRLRKKIDSQNPKAPILETLHGVGYKLVARD